ncbi:MAG: DinB family protein [Candidatus Dormibacteraeota bacterium]|nr:DinB family protein [Candidatus Dormibacteraeota bacterium]
MSADRPYLEPNSRELDRLRGLVQRLSDEELGRPIHEQWTIAGALGHIAFWDARALVLADKLERGVPFTPSDDEPEDVDWINDATSRLVHGIEPRQVAELALKIAEETDRRVATLAPERLWPEDPQSPLNPMRASHRGEHLDEIEAALDASAGPRH